MEKKFDLIQQLQTTPKWKEFEEWYIKQQVQDRGTTSWWYIDLQLKDREEDRFLTFPQLPFEFQKGVFEKFLESQGNIFEQSHNGGGCGYEYSIWSLENGFEMNRSLEELLLWYFNN